MKTIFLLINLAFTKNGTNVEEVVYELGRKGLERLNTLHSAAVSSNFLTFNELEKI